MGIGELASASKASPKESSAPKTPARSSSSAASFVSTGVAYPEWSGFQAYSPVPPQGFFPPVASSPQGHPYVWGAQPVMSPYGTPSPPFFMYPHGGVYAHPSMPPGSHPYSPYAIPSENGNPDAPGAASVVEGKPAEGKERSNLSQSKESVGNLNVITGNNSNEMSKTSGTSANGAFSQNDEIGNEGSSEGSDANSQNESEPNTGDGYYSFEDSFQTGASQNGNVAYHSQNGDAHADSRGTTQPMSGMPIQQAPTSGGVAPPTNLNIGMGYWGVPTQSQIAPAHGTAPNASVGGMLPSGQNIPSELWLQDDKEVKRHRRKQSNRESARRSRLRKQAEYEELAQRADSFIQENNVLREEAKRLHKEYDQLLSQNYSLKEKAGETPKGTKDSRLDKYEKHPLDSNP
ncbi:unnamed protein product [Spirodela intermedia]|uniref:BZIP domain-containing protein n=1 Tax=Spirodela intermedia TaxID=51605 RepID=A0A7I8JHJ7_SPIIN|nr:unnamed protein product [Spirodela intermedia]CAA6669616.1 unnamed protein product [Spirodela intermedia]